MPRAPDLSAAVSAMPTPATASPPARDRDPTAPTLIAARTRRVLPINLVAIQLDNRLRPIDRKAVRRIALSMSEIGQQTPISVRPHPDDPALFVLISGAHRVEAARDLAYEQIEAIVIDTGEHEHRLIEIDENLMRAELTHLDRGRFLAERKRIYFELHPTRRHGGDRRSETFADARQAGDDDDSGWTAETAERTSLSPRTLQRAVAIGEGIPEPLARAIATTPLANREGDLYRLSRMPEDEQARALDTLLAAPEPPKTLSAVLGPAASPQPKDPLKRIKRAWTALEDESKAEFMSWIEDNGWSSSRPEH